MKKLTSILVNICRLVVALTFIFSGFVKSIDPLGTKYKINDYLIAIGYPSFLSDRVGLISSVLLSAIEFTFGIFILLAIKRKIVTKLSFIFMLFMTAIALWLVIANPIQDCGCFGDAIHLTNGETLIKNIILLASTFVLAIFPLKQPILISKANQWIAIYFTIFFILIISFLSLYYLPLFDFRPYYIGQNIHRAMEVPKGAKQPKYKTTFICEKDGIKKEFNEKTYPYNDTTWHFIDTKQELLEKGYEPPITNFSVTDINSGLDVTNSIINRRGYTFLLISSHLEKAKDDNFGTINAIYDYAKHYGYAFYCLTASTETGINNWKKNTGAEYAFYNVDDITLKTIIRSNPGLLLLHNGIIINKWSNNNLPELDILDPPISVLSIGHISESNTWFKIIFFYVIPLFVFIFIDRYWVLITRNKKCKKAIERK